MRFLEPISLSRLFCCVNSEKLPYEIVGNYEMEINGMDDFQVALPGDLTWVDFEPFYSRVFKTDASVVIINSIPMSLPAGKTLVVTKDPKSFFDLLAKSNYDLQFPKRSFWSKLYNRKDVHIGKGCKIHKSVVMGKHINIGDNVVIEPNVVIYDNVTIGDNVIIHSNCVVGGQPFSHTQQQDNTLEPRKAWGNTIIFDNVELGAMTNIDRGITGSTIIGPGTKTSAICQIGHDTWVGRDCLICSGVTIAGYVRIENNCKFWGQSGVSNSINVAEGTCVNGCSVILKDVTTPNQTLAGFPAEPKQSYWKRMAVLRKIATEYERK